MNESVTNFHAQRIHHPADQKVEHDWGTVREEFAPVDERQKLRSLSVGESCLILVDGFCTRMTRLEDSPRSEKLISRFLNLFHRSVLQ